MEDAVQDVLIIGGGIAGLATSLGLHRLGIKSIVLESSDKLRISGYALGMWSNAWRALDALGVGDILRPLHHNLTGLVTTSVDSGIITSQLSFSSMELQSDHDLRCVNRTILLETLANQLPKGTIRYSSKVVHIETIKNLKYVHLADGTVLKTKVLIGCDGVNSVVAKFLGLSNARFTGRLAVRGLVHYTDGGHGFEPNLMFFSGKGFRYGVVPCNDRTVYWFFSFSPSPQEKDIENDPTKIKQFILSRLGKVSDRIRGLFESTKLNNMVCAPLRFRVPWELLWGNISKDNVCVAGDALHPMTPDLGQGGCVALEDAVVLARVLGEALKSGLRSDCGQEDEGENEQQRIQKGLEKFARERRMRSFQMISTAYISGMVQQSDNVVVNFLRDKMAKFFAGMLLKATRYDCGKLAVS